MMRLKPLREHFIPKGARKIVHKHSTAVLYAYERDRLGRPGFMLMGFAGRRQKPDFHYRYFSEQERLAKADAYFAAMAEQEGRERDRKAKPHQLAAGDVMRCSWGYDQTNIDYYEVVRLVGKSMVEIRAIEAGAASNDMGWTGKSVPLPGAYKGEPMRKRAEANYVRIASYAHAYKMEPVIVGGVPTYEASNWTAYA